MMMIISGKRREIKREKEGEGHTGERTLNLFLIYKMG